MLEKEEFQDKGKNGSVENKQYVMYIRGGIIYEEKSLVDKDASFLEAVPTVS